MYRKRKQTTRLSKEEKEKLFLLRLTEKANCLLHDWKNMVYSKDESIQKCGMTGSFRADNLLISVHLKTTCPIFEEAQEEGWLLVDEIVMPSGICMLDLKVVPRGSVRVPRRTPKPVPKIIKDLDDAVEQLDKVMDLCIAQEKERQAKKKEKAPQLTEVMKKWTAKEKESEEEEKKEKPDISTKEREEEEKLVEADMEEEEEEEPNPFKGMRQAALRAECKRRKISQRGTNLELVNRLVEYEQQKAAQPSPSKRRRLYQKKDFLDDEAVESETEE
jgi:hypothetical protein